MRRWARMKGKRKVTWRLSQGVVKDLKHIAIDQEVSDEEIAEKAIRRYVNRVKKRRGRLGV
jgi:predicted transcriptional regulator